MSAGDAAADRADRRASSWLWLKLPVFMLSVQLPQAEAQCVWLRWTTVARWSVWGSTW